jgi:hypothetical protein
MTNIKPTNYKSTLPRFDGTSDPFRFLRIFEYAMTVDNWHKDDWLKYLIQCLDGAADQFSYWWLDDQKKIRAAAANKDPITFDDLSLALQQAFKSHSDKDKAHLEEKCRLRKQMLNETPEAYTFALLALLRDFNPDMAMLEKIRWLIKNSQPNFIKAIKLQKPQMVDDLLMLMRRVEHTRYLMAENHEINNISDIQVEIKLDELSRKIKEADTKIDNLTSNTAECKAQLSTLTSLMTEVKEQKNPFTKTGYRNNSGNQRGGSGAYRGRVVYRGPRPLACYTCGESHSQRLCNQTKHQTDYQPQTRFTPNNDAYSGNDDGSSPHRCKYHKFGDHTTSECRYLKNTEASRIMTPQSSTQPQ